ncbi:MAG TPA: DUF5915 domain-containing protein, partial [Thermomicrobiales bacterium]|nr:DUF5915 domain-containing protein [Thermomicrobiales bacterium]
KSAAYETLYDVLVMVSDLIAPILPFTSEAMYQNLVRSLEPGAPTSVHLQDFPSPNPTVIDPELSRAMSTVLEVVRLGRSARSEVNIKTRQPLPAILVYTADPANAQAVVRLKDQILDELNVKDVRAMEDLGDVVSHDIRPNLPILGPKYGKRLGAIRSALSGMDPASVALSVEAGMSIDLNLPDGTSISVEPSEILVMLQKREGYAAAQSAAATVVLDTTLTPELVQEGLARDVVRAIQDARKQLALDIDDRIVLTLEGSEAITQAVRAYAEYVKREVLADDLRIALEGDQAETGWLDVKVGPETIRLRIDRAG